jgi:hypothetical protein
MTVKLTEDLPGFRVAVLHLGDEAGGRAPVSPEEISVKVGR